MGDIKETISGFQRGRAITQNIKMKFDKLKKSGEGKRRIPTWESNSTKYKNEIFNNLKNQERVSAGFQRGRAIVQNIK